MDLTKDFNFKNGFNIIINETILTASLNKYFNFSNFFIKNDCLMNN
jgi:hypothetical protein